ncbi:prolyl aminopeptidase [Georgenia subflava]|uniref:Proline iminopeptidase n=1 Tax=Georgenia subflava TaxID=1622177 RepID=A0A6N7ECQ5_9MICO|nr:prolyl aminopeptidase [Georgenia subflava]MPV35879.1 prolyl aminopeptidase [Georgenia subflava]
MSYPSIEPYESGLLDVGDGHHLYWEVCGNPAGKPAVVVHGGPGSGCSEGMRRWFDPAAYRIVLVDQRNAGRSLPHAGEPVVDLSANTTAHLVADLERLRLHLDVDRWLVLGVSWGSTLALAYAETHPQAVSEVVLLAVTTTSRTEVEWITRDMGRVFPEEWERFVSLVPEVADGGNIPAAYARLLADPDPAVHEPAALAWCRWEDTHVATVPGSEPRMQRYEPRKRLAVARLVTRYWANAAFLPDGALLAGAARLAGIPGVLITGRLDISGPADTAYHLHRAWPGSELHVVEDTGHGAGGIGLVETTDRFATRR